jgi:hypothetical protein
MEALFLFFGSKARRYHHHGHGVLRCILEFWVSFTISYIASRTGQGGIMVLEIVVTEPGWSSELAYGSHREAQFFWAEERRQQLS